ncbi:lytic murein transglycosylase [Pseudobacteriovorax antillogorgiicola]|uniref:Membrane-bound lytic murein transglycosylase B n=1 Tax=Pseudobacteriovorax antillogorgiicola TaxID=1513793 RepID=A0A1Y6CTG9_9BACT|nr:lytic murein transglycosylase [Pseudobacteriovorax antillogorgiicola]TCS44973.1 membrane-bound lytic murein transglycosylase B [Pseudobacteriovorax antillogorgiicola]SMF76778.1 membrane-bound lytic murein transglycosylase B [Pseudobacteriovorax antillogorgiicola]
MTKYLWLLLIIIPWSAEAKSFTKDEIEVVLKAVGKGHKAQLRPLMNDKRLKKTEGMVNLNITKPIKLSLKKYQHFLEPYAMRLARNFQRKWQKHLVQAEARYGVDKEVITAILLVETSFGRFTGKYQPLSVFASIYVDAEEFTTTKEYKDLTPDQKTRVKQKQDWALRELQAIANLSKKYPKFDQISLRGSYAGAFGKSQFLPSSYLKYAVSHKKARRPNLFDERDAIHSVANYLAKNGYRNGMNSKGSYDAIFHYNNSDVYVKTVLGVAKSLNQKS